MNVIVLWFFVIIICELSLNKFLFHIFSIVNVLFFVFVDDNS